MLERNSSLCTLVKQNEVEQVIKMRLFLSPSFSWSPKAENNGCHIDHIEVLGHIWQRALPRATSAFIRPPSVFSLCRTKPTLARRWRDERWWGLWREVLEFCEGCSPRTGETGERCFVATTSTQTKGEGLRELLKAGQEPGSRSESTVKRLWLNTEGCLRSKLLFHQEGLTKSPRSVVHTEAWSRELVTNLLQGHLVLTCQMIRFIFKFY